MTFHTGDTIYSDNDEIFLYEDWEEALEMAWDSADLDATDIVIFTGTVGPMDEDDGSFYIFDIRELHYEKIKASEYFNADDFMLRKIIGPRTTGDMK